MTFSTYNKIVEVALNQSWMSWCAVINCNNKTKKIIEKCLISDYLKIQVFIKIGFMLQATHLIICHPNLKIYENFRTAISRNKQNKFIAILLSFFMIYFANFIYSGLPNSGRGIFRALSNI